MAYLAVPMRATPRVVICGGGVAALEAMLAIREQLALRPHISVVAPNRRFVYQPMAVAEPFGQAHTQLLDLEQVVSELDAHLHPETLVGVDVDNRCVELESGVGLHYDAALIAVGARRVGWLGGAISFGGAEDVAAFTGLLERLDRGRVSRLTFTAPSRASWTLPLYELALLTASRLAERGTAGVELTIVTPEPEPLEVFGGAASRALRGQLLDRGIRIRAGVTAQQFDAGQLTLSSGEAIEAEEVVALPRLEGPRISGVPADADGFIPIDEHCRVRGFDDLYAAGDGTDFAIKQGGIATQQADVAAEAIAAQLGAPLEPATFEPSLRGMLLTGISPMFLRAEVGSGSPEGRVSSGALWSPPTKIAGRYLGPYLASSSTVGGRATLEDRPPSALSPDASQIARREARELALTFALADAHAGEYGSALSWLEVIQRLEGSMPADCLLKWDEWSARAG